MDYISTRDSGHRVSAAQAIVSGLSPDGGLFLPESLPAVLPFGDRGNGKDRLRPAAPWPCSPAS